MYYKKNNSKLIIEIGVNHNGNIRLAKKMIDVIARYDVDYIKFQSFIADELCAKNAKLAKYQKKNLNQKHVENKKNIDVKLEKFNLINYLIKILNKIVRLLCSK